MGKTGPELFEIFKKKKVKVEIDRHRYYIVEGDLLLDEQQLLAYAFQRAEIEAADVAKIAEERKGLVAILSDNNCIVRWKKGLVLTYAVLKSTFGSVDEYKIVVDAMNIATKCWEAVCGVNFRHLGQWDDIEIPETQGPLFKVQKTSANDNLIASAFFPNDHPERRKIHIYQPFFSSDLGFSKEGVLRHELGHVLGFRHEHIRSGAPPSCLGEDTDQTVDITQYDPQSVMHYFCGGVGTKELAITKLDREGARTIYGPPDHEVNYCE